MSRPARVIIDKQAARDNLKSVRKRAPSQKIMAIIKADAYGHGLVRMAQALDAADAFGVACMEEAMQLREQGISHPMVLLEGPFTADELAELAAHRIETVIHHPSQLRMLAALPPSKAVRVWLKIDSGMHRLGFPLDQVQSVWQTLMDCVGVKKPLRLMSHLASANERADGHAQASVAKQLDAFDAITQGLQAERCVANSAGIIAWRRSHYDWLRPGLLLYGVSPFADSIGVEEGLQPVMALHSELIAVNQVPAGEAVGYGATWRCPEAMPVGIVAMGYGDGYPRHAASGTPLLVKGQRASLIGKASMDMLTVDLRNVPRPEVGDPVTLWGEGLPVEEIARQADTIPYELLCRIKRRAHVVVKGG